jgi:hypothetical protein
VDWEPPADIFNELRIFKQIYDSTDKLVSNLTDASIAGILITSAPKRGDEDVAEEDNAHSILFELTLDPALR